MSFATPFVDALASVFETFGLGSGFAEAVSMLILIAVLFFIFLNLINGFEIDAKTRGYLCLIFFVGLVLLGFIPPWVLVVILILGVAVVFYTNFFSMEAGK